MTHYRKSEAMHAATMQYLRPKDNTAGYTGRATAAKKAGGCVGGNHRRSWGRRKELCHGKPWETYP